MSSSSFSSSSSSSMPEGRREPYLKVADESRWREFLPAWQQYVRTGGTLPLDRCMTAQALEIYLFVLSFEKAPSFADLEAAIIKFYAPDSKFAALERFKSLKLPSSASPEAIVAHCQAYMALKDECDDHCPSDSSLLTLFRDSLHSKHLALLLDAEEPASLRLAITWWVS